MTKTKPVAPQSLGERIAQARRLLGVEERADVMVPDLAKRVGVTAASLYNWESDGAVPGEANLTKLAEVLGVSPAWLRYGVQPGDFREGRGEIVAGRGAPVVRKPGKQA